MLDIKYEYKYFMEFHSPKAITLRNAFVAIGSLILLSPRSFVTTKTMREIKSALNNESAFIHFEKAAALSEYLEVLTKALAIF